MTLSLAAAISRTNGNLVRSASGFETANPRPRMLAEPRRLT
jgi:hypothetical protein